MSFVPLLFEASYYLGVVTGVLIAVVILGSVFNRLLTYLTFRYETSTYGAVSNPPELTQEQKNLLTNTLCWWNKQCDSWYITKSICIDKVLAGKKINLIDVQRISDSTQVGKQFGRFEPSEEIQKVFDEFQISLSKLEEKLQQEVDYKKLNHQLVKEMDILSKQLKIARYSAIAALASAIATGLLTYLTYIKM